MSDNLEILDCMEVKTKGRCKKKLSLTFPSNFITLSNGGESYPQPHILPFSNFTTLQNLTPI